MNINVIGKNVEITKGLKDRAVSKIGKLEKFFKPETDAQVTMSVQRGRHKVEVTIPFHGFLIRAEVESNDMYASIDQVVDVIEGQIRKYRTKLSKRIHEGPFWKNGKDIGKGSVEEDLEEFRIVRSKKFAPKPMDVEEAVLQMNLIGHNFFVFFNSDTEQVNVVYKRKNGNYGLIEPEF